MFKMALPDLTFMLQISCDDANNYKFMDINLMHSDTIKGLLKRLLHGSYMVDILNLLGIAPITE
jgi:hypothetical protein